MLEAAKPKRPEWNLMISALWFLFFWPGILFQFIDHQAKLEAYDKAMAAWDILIERAAPCDC